MKPEPMTPTPRRGRHSGCRAWPCADRWPRSALAHRLGHPPLVGLLAGFLCGTLVASMIFLAWLHRALRALEAG